MPEAPSVSSGYVEFQGSARESEGPLNKFTSQWSSTILSKVTFFIVFLFFFLVKVLRGSIELFIFYSSIIIVSLSGFCNS